MQFSSLNDEQKKIRIIQAIFHYRVFKEPSIFLLFLSNKRLSVFNEIKKKKKCNQSLMEIKLTSINVLNQFKINSSLFLLYISFENTNEELET